MQFKYNFTDNQHDKIPLLDVIITNPDNNRKVSYKAMLDSGAFVSVFHTEIAKVLGIDLSKITNRVPFGGVGNTPAQLSGIPYILNLMVIQKGKSHSFETAVLFSDDIHPDGMPLLGRQGFFENFSEISFNYKANYFTLSV